MKRFVKKKRRKYEANSEDKETRKPLSSKTR